MKQYPAHVLGDGVAYIRKHPQLIMTITLMVVIPVAFLVSGQQFLNAARENQERLEKERIGIMHDLFGAFLVAATFDPATIQEQISNLATQNPDITKIRVGREEGSEVRIIASLDPAQLDTFAEEPETYRIGNLNPNEAIISPYADSGVRYWQSFKLVRTANFPDHYIFIETSLEHIDTLFASRIINAYYWLVALLLIIFFLLIRHVRMIDYAYLYREVKQANEMKDLFTNMIAHELRAPLTAMRGYASMITERKGVDATTIAHALEIERASGRLVTIVSDLLDIARIQSGKMSMNATSVHAGGIVHSVIDALSPSASEKSILLAVEDNTNGKTLVVDEKRLFQALTNIVSNSIKYTKEGKITVVLIDRTDRLEIRVQDTGMGISSDDQKNLFAPFFRVRGEDMKTITGTGLGMWITKQLIELMHGSIGIESIKGVGTHVVVTIPYVAPVGEVK